MATTIPYLEITDGTNSVKLMDNLATTPALVAAMPYRLSYGNWAPKVAQRNKNPFGLPYMSVQEELTIDIKGATADIALARLQTLNTLLDRAERWWNNERVAPVFIQYQPKGSIKSTYMTDVIIGRGMGNQSDSPMITLPDDFNAVGDFYFLKGIRVTFWRRNGFWLCEKEGQSTGTSYVAQPGPITVTFSDFAPVLSPVDIDLGAGDDAAGASTKVTTSGFTAITNDNRYLVPIAGTADVAGFGAATADAAKFPTNANVNRYTVNPTQTGLWNLSTLPVSEVEYFAAFVKCRNNSTTIGAFLSGQIKTLALQEVSLPASVSGTPVVLFLGIFPTGGNSLQALSPSFPTGSFGIVFRSTGGSITIDVDELLFVGINRATNIIATSGLSHPLLTASVSIGFSHRLLSEPQGIVALETLTFTTPQPYTGSTYNFTGSSESVKKTSLAHFQISDTFWNVVNTANTAKITLDLDVSRYKAYLVPE